MDIAETSSGPRRISDLMTRAGMVPMSTATRPGRRCSFKNPQFPQRRSTKHSAICGNVSRRLPQIVVGELNFVESRWPILKLHKLQLPQRNTSTCTGFHNVRRSSYNLWKACIYTFHKVPETTFFFLRLIKFVQRVAEWICGDCGDLDGPTCWSVPQPRRPGTAAAGSPGIRGWLR